MSVQMFPAIKAQMGRWSYFIARMSMRDLATHIKYAHDVQEHKPSGLSEAIQRQLRFSRSTKEIASYLVKQEDRFFASIVVAVLGGEPHWYPVRIEAQPEFKIFRDSATMADAFGVLAFDGRQEYYALDGQHRLAAIRSLVDGNNPDLTAAPGFENEEVGIMLVVPSGAEDLSEFLVRYRRLFGNLNRHAKKTSDFDNIVMDEDDVFAIITRRLVESHPFFMDEDIQRIKMNPGKPVAPTSEHVTSLEMLYQLNIALLNSKSRRTEGWGSDGEKLKEYDRFRPADDEIDSLEDELVVCWNALIEVLPILKENGSTMRRYNSKSGPTHEESQLPQGCVLFIPIVQQMLAEVARELLDGKARRLKKGVVDFSSSEASEALSPLASLVWDAYRPPWKYVLLAQSAEDSKWKITNEDRAIRMRTLGRIIRWQLGLTKEEEFDSANNLREIWQSYLPRSGPDDADEMWRMIEAGIQR